MKETKIGYIRVSSHDQNPERQLEGVPLDHVFIDKASGGDINRPEFENLMKYLRSGDVLIVHSIDRLARNLDHLRQIVKELTGRGIKIMFIKENLTFTGDDTPMSNLLLSVMGAFAEFERSFIRERQAEGIALAKRKGAYKGKKKRFNPEQVEEIRQRVANGEKKARIAREFNIDRVTVYRYLKAAPHPTEEGVTP